MADINSLPNELLEIILSKALNMAWRGILTRCALVCKRWDEVARRVNYGTLVLDNRNVRKFASIFQSRRGRYPTKLLTVKLRIHPWNYAEPERLGGRLISREMVNILVHLYEIQKELIITQQTNLRLLSLRIDRFPERDSHNGYKSWWIPRRYVRNMLWDLAPSLTTLEVDTRGKEKGLKGLKKGKDHICDVIRLLLPRLRHLRLRLGKLCPSIIDPNCTWRGSSSAAKLTAAPHLLSLTLNLNVGLQRRSVKHCHGTSSTDLVQRPTDALFNKLATTLVRARKAGKFPSVKKLQILSEGVQDDDCERGCIVLQDCLNNFTHILPYVKLGIKRYERWMVRTISGEQIFGALVGIEEKIEGPVWDETIKGARYPAGEFKNSERAVELGVEWSRLLIKDRRGFLESLQVGKPPSWILEAWDQCKDRLVISLSNSDVIPDKWLVRRVYDSNHLESLYWENLR
ncbi:MAG: hypothetical protein Q9167_006688 [Letrouitia subvulpina]